MPPPRPPLPCGKLLLLPYEFMVEHPRAAGSLVAELTGGGGLVSTTADYARFCDMLRLQGTCNGVEIIGSRTLALMIKNHILQMMQ